MNPHLQSILKIVEQDESLAAEQKAAIAKSIKEADKELEITAFKLDRTEKVKRTTAILLEETIAELEQKRKAVEDQNKELEIEASLERVRSHAMAMRDSGDLSVAAGIVFSELKKLGIHPFRSGVGLLTQEPYKGLLYAAMEGPDYDALVLVGSLDMSAHKCMELQYESCLKQENYFPVLEGKEFKSYFAAVAKQIPIPSLPESQFRQTYYGYYFPFKEGWFYTWTKTPYTTTEINLLERFKAIIALTFRRYLDLQKAEQQAWESNIEVALERVRSKAMAMHQSADLTGAVTEVFEQLAKLDIGVLRCGIGIMNREKRTADVWVTTITGEGCSVPVTGDESFDIHPLLQGAFDAWLKRTDYSYVLKGDDLVNYYKALGDTNFHLPESQLVLSSREGSYQQDYYGAMFEAGGLFAFREGLFPDKDKAVIRRFAGVFNLTYQRFLDIQKAELQAREATIEASLERVRSRAMAMHSSEDLANTIGVFYRELKALSVIPIRCGVALIDKETRMAELTTMNTTEEGDSIEVIGQIKMAGHPVLDGVFENWLIQKEYHAVLRGNQIKEYYQVLKPQISYPDYSHDEVQFGYYFMFQEGDVYAWTEIELSEDELALYRRFTSVISLTYKRYKDLQQAEAQVKEAKIEAALERVRSRTLAMHKSEELAETATVLFRQLINLGIEPNRLYISIIADDSGNIEFWVTDEDGSKVSKQFLGNIQRNSTIKKMHDGWKAKNKSLTIDMDGKELADYLRYLSDELNVPFKSGLSQKRRVQTIAYFSKGFIGIASPEPQPGETIALLERFATVFNLTFTRFNDLKIAEAHAEQAEQDLLQLKEEKRRTEEALDELQVTQNQLIQSEKMASLGELTAGIAHEIQNPLNFVNNFSEVNKELLHEIKEELARGNLDEIITIVNDILGNEEKINHHGKRADAIVKGMLQHSRTSSGQKEPTDINQLAEEYLRLSYHGMRAKDKSFNSDFFMDFEPGIGLINIVPQDIGRLILNLINNAFYAVQEKRKELRTGYEPVVTVSTKKAGDTVILTVKDNGNGIRKGVLEKIFQPFFTTKPTGQGTGLGLSLSYDIVKAHGGELKVETREKEGSEFIVILLA